MWSTTKADQEAPELLNFGGKLPVRFRVAIAVTGPSIIEVRVATLDRWWSTASPLRNPDGVNRRSFICGQQPEILSP